MKLRWWWRIDGSVGFREYEATLGTQDGPSVFVEEPMMEPTQQDQIVKVGGPTPRPVDDVMSMHPIGPTASGEPAAAVTFPQLPSQPARDGPTITADTQRLVPVEDSTFDDRVTGQPPGRLMASNEPSSVSVISCSELTKAVRSA